LLWSIGSIIVWRIGREVDAGSVGDGDEVDDSGVDVVEEGELMVDKYEFRFENVGGEEDSRIVEGGLGAVEVVGVMMGCVSRNEKSVMSVAGAGMPVESGDLGERGLGRSMQN
ncbi:hypothetical protein Dimus_028846, partial [Dionaea muscipula]